MLTRPQNHPTDAAGPHEFRRVRGDLEPHRLMKASPGKLHQPDHRPHQPSHAMLDVDRAFSAQGRQVGSADMGMQGSECFSQMASYGEQLRATASANPTAQSLSQT